MSNALLSGARRSRRLALQGTAKFLDSMISDGPWDPYGDVRMGTAPSLRAQYQLSRQDQDAFALESYRRARQATESGAAAREIVPIELPQKKGDPLRIDRDEEPFKSDLAKIGGLKPAFEKDGTVTAGNASKINDGAAALVLTTAEPRRRLGKPIARIVATRRRRSRSGSPPRRWPFSGSGRAARRRRHRPVGNQRGLLGGRSPPADLGS
jgi:acetyl-CoA C-acetyltransferase